MTFNGIGAFLVVVTTVTGAVIWWPGIKNWRRSNFRLSYPLHLWITRLHFGPFNGVTEALRIILGLARGILAITGALM